MPTLDFILEHPDNEELRDLYLNAIRKHDAHWLYSQAKPPQFTETYTIESTGMDSRKPSCVSILKVHKDCENILNELQNVETKREAMRAISSVHHYLALLPVSTLVYTFDAQNGYLSRAERYRGDWKQEGFRWNEKRVFLIEAHEMENNFRLINSAYEAACKINRHLTLMRQEPNLTVARKDFYDLMLLSLSVVVQPETIREFQRSLPT